MKREADKRLSDILDQLGPMDLARLAAQQGRRNLEALLAGHPPDEWTAGAEASQVGERATQFSDQEFRVYGELHEQRVAAVQAALAVAPGVASQSVLIYVAREGRRGWALVSLLGQMLEAVADRLDEIVKACQPVPGDPGSGQQAEQPEGLAPEELAGLASLPALLGTLRQSAASGVELMEGVARVSGEESAQSAATVLEAVAAIEDRLGVPVVPDHLRRLLDAGRNPGQGEALVEIGAALGIDVAGYGASGR
jgi:hypothetical protein